MVTSNQCLNCYVLIPKKNSSVLNSACFESLYGSYWRSYCMIPSAIRDFRTGQVQS